MVRWVEGAAVGQVSLVNAASVRSLTCPYCGRRMPRDEPGMFAAQARWGSPAPR
ncbi:MAG: hypothetical protein HZY73_00300 [Micropruina sp.]|nr:MAG: hypothetical protein HZY73_00300 [Micropruina sp.]